MRKSLIHASLSAIFCISSACCFAIQPVSGPYAGIFLGPSYTPNIDFNFNPYYIPPEKIDFFKRSFASFSGLTLEQLDALLQRITLPNQNIPGKLKMSMLGGIGGDIGYRIHSDYRLEAELLYNDTPISDVTIGNYTIGDSESGPTINIDGDLNTVALMFNFIYEIPIKSHDGFSAFRPYLGGGVGYAYAFNSLTFQYGENTAEQADGAAPTTLYETTFSNNHSLFAVQGILGMSYFIDDFCWLSLDARYFTAPIAYDMNKYATINFQTNTSIYSVMIGFHGIIGHG
jgi:opacity protein-like surface antigen